MTNYEKLKLVQLAGFNNEVIKKLLDSNSGRASALKTKYDRYIGESVPIHKRAFEYDDKVNNKLMNDFVGEIVDTTIINGEVVVKDGHLTKVSEEEIIRNTNRISKDMVERAQERTGIEFLKKPTLLAH